MASVPKSWPVKSSPELLHGSTNMQPRNLKRMASAYVREAVPPATSSSKMRICETYAIGPSPTSRLTEFTSMGRIDPCTLVGHLLVSLKPMTWFERPRVDLCQEGFNRIQSGEIRSPRSVSPSVQLRPVPVGAFRTLMRWPHPGQHSLALQTHHGLS